MDGSTSDYLLLKRERVRVYCTLEADIYEAILGVC